MSMIIALFKGNIRRFIASSVVGLLGLGAATASRAQTCELYPIAVSAQTLSNVASNTVVDIFNGAQPGNFGWLSWGGSPSEPTLVASLTPPGNSATYVNPEDAQDHQVGVGDWVSSKPGVSNSKKVREALEVLKTMDIIVPVWNQTRGAGEHAAYRVAAFARVRILSYQLPSQNRITARFLGYTICGVQNTAPRVNAGADQTITLPATAALVGSATDDGLPAGSTLTTAWSQVSGPGTTTFADATAASTSAAFSAAGVYVLRLTASDSQLTASDDVMITVNRENHPPAANQQSLATDEDVPLDITLTGSDPDGDALTFIVASQPAYGSLTGTPPNLTYRPKPDYNGLDSFTFKVNDGLLDSALATVTITNRPVNDAPVADSQLLTTPEDTALNIVLSGSDVEGRPLTFTLLQAPTNGILTGTAPHLIYQPNTNYHGPDALLFKVNDGELDSAPGLVEVEVISVNDAPLVEAGPDALTSLPSNSVALSGNVWDDAFFDTNYLILNWSQVSGPGTAAFVDASALATTATFSAPGVYLLEFTADDGLLAASDTVVVTVNGRPTVSGGPDVLVTYPDSATLNGFATDDGLPTNGMLSVAWSEVSGPGTAHFSAGQNTNTTATFSESGVYVVRLTASDSLVEETDEVTVVVNRAPIVDAGSDQTNSALQAVLAGSVSDDGLPAGAALALQWSKISGPGEVVFASATNASTTVSSSQSGVYVLRLSASDSAAEVFDDVTLTANAAPVVNAGTNQIINFSAAVTLLGSVIDDGLPIGGTVSVQWSKASGPGEVVFENAAHATTSATFSQGGVYVLRLIADDTLVSATNEVTVFVNTAPVVSAGTNQTIVLGSATILPGSATDDGLPPGVPLSVQWAVVSGPGVMALNDPFSLQPQVSFNAVGSYVVRLTVSDSLLSGSSDVTITVKPVNHPPAVYAGTNQLILFPAVAALTGVVNDDGEPAGGTLTLNWSKVGGPGAVTFANASAAVTSATFDAPGAYLLSLVANDGELSSTGLVSVIANQAPQVNAGPDQVSTLTNELTLNGVVTDDGLPANTLEIAWNQVSGPGTALFTPPTAAQTGVRFSAAGNYVLRLSVTDGHALGTDDVQVTVRVSGENLPPVVEAGTNLFVALTNRAELTGAVADDGLPEGVTVSVAWDVLSGPGSVSFGATNNPVTFALFGAPGHYVLRLTATDTEYTTSDEMTVDIYPDNQPPVPNAGADQTLVTGPATLSGSVTDDGLPTGGVLTFFWSKVSGPGVVAFANSNSAVTIVTFSEAGVYAFRFTASDSQFSASDDVVVTVTGNQAPWVNAGTDQVLDLFVASGGATNSTVLYPPNPDAWRYEASQPGLSGVWGNIGSVSVGRGGLAWDGSDLYVGGGFKYANGLAVSNLTRWDGCGYSGLYDARPSIPTNPASPAIGFVTFRARVEPIAAHNGEVFVCGGFLKDLNGDGSLDWTARWSGTGWESWHWKGLNSVVSPGAMLATSNAVYVCGQFRIQPGSNAPPQDNRVPWPGVPISFNVAKWDGTNWAVLGEGVRGLNSGTNWTDANTAWVKALAVSPTGDLYAGGRFVMETPTGYATNLVRWDGTNWWPVGTVGFTSCTGGGCVPEVLALAVAPNGDLFAGGDFKQVGALAANYIARWDGTSWSTLGTGMNNQVEALTFRGAELYAGGRFSQAGGQTVNRLARWNGTNWLAVSNGVNSTVAALATTPNGVYAGGQFVTAGGQTANYIAKWGQRELPTLTGPDPLVVPNAPSGGADVAVTLFASQPCGGALTLTWNVDGGDAERTDTLPAGTTATSQAVTFTNFYTPGTHTLVATLDDAVSGPVTFATTVTVLTPATTTLAGSVSDDGLPSGTLIGTWTELTGPVAVTLSQPSTTNTQPSTSAAFTAVGSYVLRLTGNDTELQASDDVAISVRAAGNTNRPPTVSAGSDQFIALDEAASLQGVALDDGLPTNSLATTWTQASGPGGVTFADSAHATTTATFSAPGVYVLRLSANDSEFTSYDELTITVSAQTNAAPVVNAGPDQTLGLAQTAALMASVTDDGLPFGTLVSQWETVSGPGSVTLRVQNGVTYATFSDVGQYVLRLNANDGRRAAFDDVTITVLANAPGPVVAIHSPADAATVTAPTAIIGTASSDILQSWVLEYRLAGNAEGRMQNAAWSVLASNTVAVVNNTLAVFDPTLLLNGIYELRLTATDQVGRTALTDPVTVIVDRNLKIGHFTLSFSDLSVPVPGLPLQITRTYDSRAAAAGIQGDFGIGWTLDIRNVRLQKNRSLSRNWDQTTTGSPWDLSLAYHLDPVKARLVTITFPDGRVEKFRLDPAPLDQALLPIGTPQWRFTPLGNTRGTLVPAGYDEPDGSFLYFAGGVPGTGDLFDLNSFFDWLAGSGTEEELYRAPTIFRYTTPEGYAYLIDELAGLQSVTDPNGNTLLISTNGLTWTNSLAGTSGLSIAFQRDVLGRITNIVDAAGHAMGYGYSANGNLVSFVDRVGQTNGFAYTNAAFPHHLTGIVDGRGVTPVQNAYDANGRLVANVDAFGNVIGYGHDLANNREYITNRLGQVTVNEYDEHGNVTRVIDPLGGEMLSAYDANGNLLRTVDPLGRTNSYTYDALDNRLTATDPLGHTTRFTYGAQRRVTSVTDPRGNTITNIFDGNGNLLSMRDPLGNVTRFGYDSQGLPVAMTNALGQVMRFGYDAKGRLTNEVDALGHATSYQRDANGNLLTQTTTRTTPSGLETLTVQFQYDTQGRLTNSIFPDGSTASTLYNAIGKPAVTIDQQGRATMMEYDELGRITRTIYPDGSIDTGGGYDAEGRRIASTNRLGQVTRFEYDANGRLFRTVLPDGASTTNWFDLGGQLLASTDARGNSTFYGYDAAGRSVAVTNALGEVSRSFYDVAGNLTNAVDALGRSTRFIYDALNRRVQTVFADGCYGFFCRRKNG